MIGVVRIVANSFEFFICFPFSNFEWFFAEMNLGELAKSSNFQLSEAMSAIG